MESSISRRAFIGTGAAALAGGAASAAAGTAPPAVEGFEKQTQGPGAHAGWTPVSDRKIRVGIAGYGYCRFGAMFGFQDHPNVEVAAVSDLIPERCAMLAEACRCAKTYPSLEDMVKDDRLEAVFVATDAPSHAKHCIEVLRHGKHVATAVPAVFGRLDEIPDLLDAVKKSGRNYMMFETSSFREDLYAMRRIYAAGGFGRIVYAEGEYFHYGDEPIPSFQGWRVGLPPMWYPTHSTAYFTSVMDGHFTEVSCLGIPGRYPFLRADGNPYRNPFGTEFAFLRTSEQGAARMAVSWDTPGYNGEMGRVRGETGAYYKTFVGLKRNEADVRRPPLPPGVEGGGHGGSHGYLMNEFILSILENRKPMIGVVEALDMTVPGILAHESALKDGEWLKIPRFAV